MASLLGQRRNFRPGLQMLEPKRSGIQYPARQCYDRNFGTLTAVRALEIQIQLLCSGRLANQTQHKRGQMRHQQEHLRTGAAACARLRQTQAEPEALHIAELVLDAHALLFFDGAHVDGAGSTMQFRWVKMPTNDELAQQELSKQIDALLRAIEKLCAQSEKALGKDSPQAQQMRTQQQTTQVLVDAVHQIEKYDAKIFPDKRM